MSCGEITTAHHAALDARAEAERAERERQPSLFGDGVICAGPGCTKHVQSVGRGRPPEFCSSTCRGRARRDRSQLQLAVDAAELLQAAPESVAIRALACLPASALVTLTDHLPQRSAAI